METFVNFDKSVDKTPEGIELNSLNLIFLEFLLTFGLPTPSLRGNNSCHCNPDTQHGDNCPALC